MNSTANQATGSVVVPMVCACCRAEIKRVQMPANLVPPSRHIAGVCDACRPQPDDGLWFSPEEYE
ncbi:MAG: hypothetical protein ACJ8HU_03070 [Chthoniobacterales bacterium]